MAPGDSPDDIAIIGWSVSPMVRHTDKTEAQMLLEVVSGACEHAGAFLSVPYAADYVFLRKGG